MAPATMLVRPLSPELENVARLEENETPERLENDLRYIKEWLSKQPHLPEVNDDQFLVSFLRGCKYSLERTKEKLDFYFSIRGAVPEFYANRDPIKINIKDMYHCGFLFALPELAPRGRRVILGRITNKDLNHFNMELAVKLVLMGLEILMREDDHAIVNGIILVYDLGGFRLNHMASLTIPVVKKYVMALKNAFPIRVTEIHILNPPTMVDKVLGLFSPFMHKKLNKRMLSHGKSIDSVYQYVPKNILPKDYGGDQPSVIELMDKWRNKLESYKDWYVAEEDIKTDETKRPGKPKTASDLLGMEGSFRKLAVD